MLNFLHIGARSSTRTQHTMSADDGLMITRERRREVLGLHSDPNCGGAAEDSGDSASESGEETRSPRADDSRDPADPNEAGSPGDETEADVQLKRLSAVFNLPQKEAAARCGMALSTFKKLCRRLGVRRWPYRKYRSIGNQLDRLTSQIEVHHIPLHLRRFAWEACSSRHVFCF